MKKVDVAYSKRRASAKTNALTKDLRAVVKNKPAGFLKEVKAATDETWKEISCVACGHCCMEMTPTWKKSEIKRVAAHVGMTSAQYYEKYLYTEEKTGDIMNDSTPCQHFDKKKGLCTIYEIRPADCAEFPHFHRKDFADQVEEVFLPNMVRCPATLVMVEKITERMREKGVIK
jgi:Fe-S-cluster containining protein